MLRSGLVLREAARSSPTADRTHHTPAARSDQLHDVCSPVQHPLSVRGRARHPSHVARREPTLVAALRSGPARRSDPTAGPPRLGRGRRRYASTRVPGAGDAVRGVGLAAFDAPVLAAVDVREPPAAANAGSATAAAGRRPYVGDGSFRRPDASARLPAGLPGPRGRSSLGAQGASGIAVVPCGLGRRAHGRGGVSLGCPASRYVLSALRGNVASMVAVAAVVVSLPSSSQSRLRHRGALAPSHPPPPSS